MENKVKYLNEREVSNLTGLALPTLRNHRSMGRGLPYIKLFGKTVRYSFQDVVDFFENHKVQPSDDRA